MAREKTRIAQNWVPSLGPYFKMQADTLDGRLAAVGQYALDSARLLGQSMGLFAPQPRQAEQSILRLKRLAFLQQKKTDKQKLSKAERAELKQLQKALKQRQQAVKEQDQRLMQRWCGLEEKVSALLAEKKGWDQKEAALKEKGETLSSAESEARIDCFKKIDALYCDKLDLNPELIREHAQRRNDLFFLLMVAVYKKRIVIEKGPTILQHGQGSKGNQACHSSLFPNIITRPLPSPPPPASSSFWAYLPSFAIKDKANESFHIGGTVLEDLLNSTVELPKVVNNFDSAMEWNYGKSIAVESFQAILNRVASGEWSPVQGMNEYFRVMALFFNHAQYKHVEKKASYAAHAKIPYPKAFAKAWLLEKEGTFRAAKRVLSGDKYTWQVRPSYVDLQLGLTQLSAADYAQHLVSSRIQTQAMMAVQARLLQASDRVIAAFSKKIQNFLKKYVGYKTKGLPENKKAIFHSELSELKKEKSQRRINSETLSASKVVNDFLALEKTMRELLNALLPPPAKQAASPTP